MVNGGGERIKALVLTTDTHHFAVYGCGIKFNRMLKGLSVDRAEKYIGQIRIQKAGPKRGFHILVDVSQQTGADPSIRRKPEPVALLTEMVANGADKADFPDGAV
jgi:hypothetical protein